MIGESRSQKIFKVFNYTFLLVFGILALYPFWYVLVASFNLGRDFSRGGVYFFPRVFTLENYMLALNDPRILNSIKVSVGSTIVSVFASLLVTALFSYAISVKTLPGRTFFAFFFFLTTIVSGGMIPYYLLLRDLSLTRSFWLYVTPGLFNFFNFLLMRTFFDNIPQEMRESAHIDGAGELTVLFRIYLPLSTPILATLALFLGVGRWNDWFMGAYYQSNKELYPAATLLKVLLSEAMSTSTIKMGQETTVQSLQSYTPQSLQMAFVMILTMPIVIVYPFLQKYYVKGVMVGSVKG